MNDTTATARTVAYTDSEAADEIMLLLTRKLRRLHPEAFADLMDRLPEGAREVIGRAERRADSLRACDQRDKVTRIIRFADRPCLCCGTESCEEGQSFCGPCEQAGELHDLDVDNNGGQCPNAPKPAAVARRYSFKHGDLISWMTATQDDDGAPTTTTFQGYVDCFYGHVDGQPCWQVIRNGLTYLVTEGEIHPGTD